MITICLIIALIILFMVYIELRLKKLEEILADSCKNYIDRKVEDMSETVADIIITTQEDK